MTRDVTAIKSRLTEKGLKVTPQRMAVLDAIYSLNNHPTVENITEFIRRDQPNIAVGTVYKVLDTLVENGIVKRVKTESDFMRYDGVLDQHHHLYCSVSDRIEDYSDPELDQILGHYFHQKGIPGFRIDEIKLQLKGRFREAEEE